jgi:hypothetical protein
MKVLKVDEAEACKSNIVTILAVVEAVAEVKVKKK